MLLCSLKLIRIVDGRLFMYTAKTGTHVYLPLKPEVLRVANPIYIRSALDQFIIQWPRGPEK